MARYGFAIDNGACIGCHACSTACKSENEVPLGVFRTWVKTVEVGTYPDTQRHFQVTRCNHCEKPPCATICPTSAMYKRPDGIVEFDKDACIGCKACMQACPYDAIYIDPETSTASKCHFCAHRTDIGLEPACVVVCPEHAILAGDLDDPNSEIAKVLAKNPSTVRKPEQGTEPKLFYIHGNQVSLRPGETANPSPPYTTDRRHVIPWHWPVPAYLVAKGIGAGAILVLALAWLLLDLPVGETTAVAGGLLALVATGATTALLVYDLEHPKRFLYILKRPNWRSWLARGAVILIGFSTITGLWFALETGAWLGLLSADLAAAFRAPLLWLNLPFAAMTAVYTAFLFGQAEGRDLWQSPLLPLHLLLQAVLAGSAALMLLGPVFDITPEVAALLRTTLLSALVIDLVAALPGELLMPHASEVASRAAKSITRGRHARRFWVDVIGIGHLVPIGVLALSLDRFEPAAALAALVGLYFYEAIFVQAPQEIPNA
jgi:Fe-S-cluster-containing dehydrogenase component/formate-dependent nitrite reductase membrane component NrfD